MEGTINPQLMIAAPPAHVGILAGNAGTEVVREWSTIEGEGPLDTRTAPMMCAMVLDGTIGAGSIVGAGPAYTFDVARHMTADNLKSATWWWGDASSGDIYKALYGMIDEWTIENDVTSDDGARMGIAGTAKEMDDIAPPALAAVGLAPIMVGKNIQVWIDAYSGTIGTTEVTNRVLGATHTIPTGVTYKYPATGPAGGVSYTETGRVTTVPQSTLKFHVNADLAEWDKYQAKALYKFQVRHNGPVIETTNRHYVQVQFIGRLGEPTWGDLEGSNRTIEFTILHEYDTTFATDTKVKIQGLTTTVVGL
jgi:xanthosine utilization system XapX-like protein